MVTNILLVIASVWALTSGRSSEIEHMKDDYVIKTGGPGHRLAGWNISPNTAKCDMVRRHLKTFSYCWLDENEAKGINTQKERGWVREVIKQWEKCGGIRFVEEPKCRSGEDFVTIEVGNYHPKVIPDVNPQTCKINGYNMLLNFYTFGENIKDYSQTEKIRESMIKMYGLHEFGHFIGFDHEHNRNDRPAGCDTPVDATQLGSDAIYGNYHISKEYDPKSIMNYCRQNGHYKPVLSDLDKRGVWATYGGGDWNECEAATKPWKWYPGDGLSDNRLKELDMESKGITCYDLLSTPECENLKASCKDETMKTYYCRVTCKFCVDDSKSTNSTSAGCVDLASKAECDGWTSMCNTSGTRYWCPKTCNAC